MDGNPRSQAQAATTKVTDTGPSAPAAAMDATVAALLAAGTGILAADESIPTIGKRFAALGIASTAESHRDYREMLFTTPGLPDAISGVILFDETIRQRTRDGVPMAELLAARGIVPGIKVDGGTVDLPGFPGEKSTQGLDGLRERLVEYRGLGARFTKWRAVIAIGEGLPSRACLQANAVTLALFAAFSQEAGLVPIVEPEVLMEGDHDLVRCEEVMSSTLAEVFAALSTQRVDLKRMLLKTAMVTPGTTSAERAEVGAIASATRRCLLRVVPNAVAGIVFLSGGQAEEEATQRLAAICQPGGLPWTATFSYGRALQDSALRAWHGEAGKVAAGQEELARRARANGDAVRQVAQPG
jgi:fructose-bisphosphate aldolase class I